MFVLTIFFFLGQLCELQNMRRTFHSIVKKCFEWVWEADNLPLKCAALHPWYASQFINKEALIRNLYLDAASLVNDGNSSGDDLLSLLCQGDEEVVDAPLKSIDQDVYNHQIQVFFWAVGTNNRNGMDDKGADDKGADDEGADDKGADDKGADDEGADDEGADDEGADDEGADDEGADDKGADEKVKYGCLKKTIYLPKTSIPDALDFWSGKRDLSVTTKKGVKQAITSCIFFFFEFLSHFSIRYHLLASLILPFSLECIWLFHVPVLLVKELFQLLDRFFQKPVCL